MTLLTEPTRIVLAKGQPVPVDLQGFGSVSLLLHGNLVTTSTNIVDSSSSPKTVTPVGNAQISTAIADPFGNSTGVIAFDGTGDWLTVPFNDGWSFGLNNFTVECWFRTSSTNQYASLVSADGTGINGWSFLLNPVANDGKLTFYEPNLAPSLLSTATGGLNNNQWHHAALVKNGTLLSIYVNGISSASLTTSASASLPGTLYVGGSVVGGSRALNGYIDDLRITKGVARYTANFTPPTAPFPDI